MNSESSQYLSRGQSNHAMRSFVVASGLWGAWGQAVGFGTTAFTGFILYIGGNESIVALFTSLAYSSKSLETGITTVCKGEIQKGSFPE